MATDTPKKTRKPKRNFKAELDNLRLYVGVKLDVLKSIDTGAGDPLWKSSIEAYEDIQRRIAE